MDILNASPDETAEIDTAQRKRALFVALVVGGLCTVVFGVLAWDYLSWPNRQALGALLQVPALIVLIYQYQYGAFVLRSNRLPAKLWPMRIIALTMGGMFGAMAMPIQVQLAEQWFQERQNPLVESLRAAEDPCATFKRNLADNLPGSRFETPDLYSGTVENVYGGRPQFVLAFRAKSDGDGMIVYYHSGSRKWITTMRSNERGMVPLMATIKPLARCDGPAESIVRVRRDE